MADAKCAEEEVRGTTPRFPWPWLNVSDGRALAECMGYRVGARE